MTDPRRYASALEYTAQPNWLDSLAASPVGKAAKGFVGAQKDQLQNYMDLVLSGNPLTRPFVAGGEHDAFGNLFNTGKQIGQSLVNDPGALANALRGGFADAVRNIQTPEGAGRAVGNLFSPMEVASGLQGLAKPILKEMTVYHGTPHRFPPTERNPLGEFDASKIGTGEGAQAYGHGLYLAESPDVAKSYRYVHAPRGEKYTATAYLAGAEGNKDAAISSYLKDMGLSNDTLIDWEKKNRPDLWVKKQEMIDEIKSTNAGALYHVDLPDPMIEKMLDWDKPLSEQHESVRKVLSHLGNTTEELAAHDDALLNALYNDGKAPPMVRDPSGQDIYHKFVRENGPQKASQRLKELGIPGIRYLDAGSRDAATGTRNFVIFPGEEKNLKILERK